VESKKKKKLIFLAVKILVSALLLTLVFRKAGLQSIYSHLRSMDLRYFLASSLLHILVVYIAALRWRLLLDVKYPSGKLFSLYLIGSFFNNILPGAVGGDTVKIYYLYKETRKGGSSFGSVFLDRYIGLVGLLFIGLVSGFIAFRDLKTIGMQWAIPSMFAVFMAGSLIVFGLRIGRRFAVIHDFYEYLHQYRRKKGTLLKAFSLSVLIQTIAISMIYLVALGIGQQLTFTSLFVFVPIIVTVTTLPISISGLGVRESAFVLLFGLVGIPAQESVAISFLWFLSVAAASLIGLVEYLRFRNTRSGEAVN
jgi:uncharacterized membrane protein YbhN (UPF0104 family)